MTNNRNEPRGYRVHSNTWTAYGPQMPVDEVLDVLDRVDDHFDTAMQSLRPVSAPQVVNDSAFRDDLIATIAGHVIAGTQSEPDFNVEALADAVLEKVVRRLSAIVVQAAVDDPVAQLVKAEIRQMRWER